MSCISPQVICRCSSQPLNPKWMEFINHNVFNKASAVLIPSRFFIYRMMISSSFMAYAAFGLLPFPSFSVACFEPPKLFEFFQVPPLYSLDIYKLSSYGWSWNEILSVRPKGSNSSPSFLLTVMINSLKKSFSCFIWRNLFQFSPRKRRKEALYPFLSKKPLKWKCLSAILIACSCFPAPE